MSRLIGLVLILGLISVSEGQFCTEKTSFCNACYVSCNTSVSFNETCGFQIQNNNYTLEQSDSIRENITFSFVDKYCYIGQFNLIGSSNSNNWNIKFESRLKESVIFGGKINLVNLNTFESPSSLKYAKEPFSSLNLFQVYYIKRMVLSGDIFNSSYFGSNLQGSLIYATGSSIQLSNFSMKRLGVVSNSNLVYLSQSNLTIQGEIVEISDCTTQGALFYLARGTTNINFDVGLLLIRNNYAGQGIFNLFSADSQNYLYLNARETIQFSNNSGPESYAIFLKRGAKIVLSSQDSIVFEGSQSSLSPLANVSTSQAFSIMADGDITFRNFGGTLFSNPQNLQIQGRNVSFINVKQIFNQLGSKATSIKAKSAIRISNLTSPGRLSNLSLNLEASEIHFQGVQALAQLSNYSQLNVLADQLLTFSSLQFSAGAFVSVEGSSQATFRSGGDMSFKVNSAALFELAISGQAIVESNGSLLFEFSSVSSPQSLIKANSNNLVRLRSLKKLSFQQQGTQFENVTLIHLEGSENTVALSSEEDLTVGGLSKVLSLPNSTQKLNNSLFIHDLGFNNFSITSKQNIIFENIATPQNIIKSQQTQPNSSISSMIVNAAGDIIFRNIYSTQSILSQDIFERSTLVSCEGSISFSSLWIQKNLVSLGKSSLKFESQQGIVFDDIGGTNQSMLEYLFYFDTDMKVLTLSSSGFINFSNVQAVKNTTSFLNAFLFDFASRNQTLNIQSSEGVSIDRPTNSTDYKSNYNDQIMNLEWVFASNGKFLQCLPNCQKCQNISTCQICKKGAAISPDRKSCKINSTPSL